MSMAKLTGWQKAGLIAGVGCLSTLGVLVVGIVAAVVWARAPLTEFGDATPVRAERSIRLAESPISPTDRAGSGTDRTPLRLEVDLQEGQFTIRPGAPGQEVQVRPRSGAPLPRASSSASARSRVAWINALFGVRDP